MDSYKIAVVTEDSQKISSHFGMAPLYRIFTIENGQIQKVEERQKPHHQVHPQHGAGGEHTHEHGTSHEDMFAPAQDCQVLIVGGMGKPAFQKAESLGMQVVLTNGSIQDTVEAYLKGQVQSDERRVH